MVKKKGISKKGSRSKKLMLVVAICLLILLWYMYLEGAWIFEKKAPPVKTIESTADLAKEYNKYLNLTEEAAEKANEIMIKYNKEKDLVTRSILSQEYLNHAAYMTNKLEESDKFITANEQELTRNKVKIDDIRDNLKHMATTLKNNLESMKLYEEITAQQEPEYTDIIETLDKLIE